MLTLHLSDHKTLKFSWITLSHIHSVLQKPVDGGDHLDEIILYEYMNISLWLPPDSN